MEDKWTLEGYDPSKEEIYSIPGEFDSEEEAKAAGVKRLGEPKTMNHWVFIIRPDGSKYRLPT